MLRNGVEMRLSPTEWLLLAELARNAGITLDHRTLLQRVWGPQYADERNYLRTFAQRLRAKLEDDPARPEVVIPLAGRGTVSAPCGDTASRLNLSRLDFGFLYVMSENDLRAINAADSPVNGGHPDANATSGPPLARRLLQLVEVVAAMVVPMAVGAGLVPFRTNISPATAALGMAVAVSLVAALSTRLGGVVAAASAALSFDFFFTKPYGSLSISSAQEIETAILMLVCGLIVGQLSARNRTNKELVVRTSDDFARIQSIAELMASGAGAFEVVSAVGDELTELFGLRSCRFERTVPDGPSPTVERNGDVSWGRFWWGVRTLGLPGKEVTLVVEHQRRRLGRYVLVAVPGSPVTREQLAAAVTLADQAGAALGLEAAAVASTH
ncbi:MAG: DUF4118 domain-containing protein [Solirubrobacteraceae bacterium]